MKFCKIFHNGKTVKTQKLFPFFFWAQMSQWLIACPPFICFKDLLALFGTLVIFPTKMTELATPVAILFFVQTSLCAIWFLTIFFLETVSLPNCLSYITWLIRCTAGSIIFQSLCLHSTRHCYQTTIEISLYNFCKSKNIKYSSSLWYFFEFVYFIPCSSPFCC